MAYISARVFSIPLSSFVALSNVADIPKTRMNNPN